ncbi:hypothetical protein L218DRAFT_988002 [Marasmius fiardii PR-910]|nr:hypothetical protein L218DRAFT_988002 [Marasmius fiardii PR-910]
MHFTVPLTISAFLTITAALEIRSNNAAFPNVGRQGCITASSNTTGATVVIQDCGANISEQDWTFTPFAQGSSPQPLKVLGDKCLDVIGGSNVDGTKLQIWTCVPGNTNQLWTPLGDSTFQWAGTNKCIDLTNGNITNGNQLQVWTCDPNNSNQQWSPAPVVVVPPPPVRIIANGGGNFSCMSAASNVDGASVLLDSCNDDFAWFIPSSGSTGPITTIDKMRCLDVRDGNPSNGNLLQIWTCIEGSPNQLWNIAGPVDMQLISWAGQNKCVDVKDGNYTVGNALQIWDCDSSNRNQWWGIGGL